MSKIDFYKNLIKVIKESGLEPDANLTNFIKEYVNLLETLPTEDEAITYIFANYKSKPKTTTTTTTTTTNTYNIDGLNLKPDELFKKLGFNGFDDDDMKNCKQQ